MENSNEDVNLRRQATCPPRCQDGGITRVDDPARDDEHGADDPALRSDEEHEDDEQLAKAPKGWDEGGPSDCGYSIRVHETLMSVGKSVHKVFGDPSEGLESAMKAIGNWFQEASYATRDIIRGEDDDFDLHEDATGTFHKMHNDASNFFRMGEGEQAKDEEN